MERLLLIRLQILQAESEVGTVYSVVDTSKGSGVSECIIRKEGRGFGFNFYYMLTLEYLILYCKQLVYIYLLYEAI